MSMLLNGKLVFTKNKACATKPPHVNASASVLSASRGPGKSKRSKNLRMFNKLM